MKTTHQVLKVIKKPTTVHIIAVGTEESCRKWLLGNGAVEITVTHFQNELNKDVQYHIEPNSTEVLK